MATVITKPQLKFIIEKVVKEQLYGKAKRLEQERSGRAARPPVDEKLQDAMEAIADWESDYPSLMSKITGAKRKKLVAFLLDDNLTSMSTGGWAAESLLYFLDEIAAGGL